MIASPRSIGAAFARQAALRPSKIAIEGSSWQPTYGELDEAANALALRLLERGHERGMPVAVLLPVHEASLPLACLAIVKAGGAMLVLNDRDPAERLAALRALTAAPLVVTDAERSSQALAAGFETSQLVVLAQDAHERTSTPPLSDVAGEELAALICTSGTTGSPVAVMQPHRNVIHNVARHTQALSIAAEDRVIMLASPSGGQGVAVLWTALLNGATLCPFPTATRGLAGLADWIETLEITYLTAPASLFRHFVATLGDRRIAGVRIVRLGSEMSFRHDVDAWRAHFEQPSMLAATYSSSETGAITHNLIGPDEELDEGELVVGKPARDVEIAVTDDNGSPVEPGVVGNVIVRAHHLSPGYWRDEALTAARFRQLAGGLREFATGDLGRLDGGGRLTVLGRGDDLVKVNGNRVSLAEVEGVLAAQAAVVDAAVRASVTPRGEACLTAYVTASSRAMTSAADLRRALAARLPSYAVPTEFVFLGALPLNAHGKLEARDLPQPSAFLETETEELLAGIWCEALELERVGREDDFFELGGDSLAAAEVAAAIHGALGVTIDMRVIATESSLARLAMAIDDARRGATEAPVRALPRTAAPGELRSSFAQERIWQHCAGPHGPEGYTVVAVMSVSGPIDLSILRESVKHIATRHEMLRTTFSAQGGELVQVVHAQPLVDVGFVDLSGDPEPAAAAQRLLEASAAEPFDLEQGPLLRLTLVRLEEDRHQLQRVNHHIISDGDSWRVFLEELAAIYPALARGEQPPLPRELALQPRDAAAWEARFTPGSPELERSLAWWRRLARSASSAPPPFARSEPDVAAQAAEGRITWGLAPDLTARLEKLAREQRVTYFTVRLAAFAALLAASSSTPEVLIGTYATRRRPELAPLFGCFAHAVPVSLSFERELTCKAWLARVRAAALEAADHAELSYERAAALLAEEGLALPPIYVAFMMATQRRRSVRFGDIEIGPRVRSFTHYMPAGFELVVSPGREHDECRASFDPRIYDRALVTGFVAGYQALLDAMSRGATRAMDEVLNDVLTASGPT